MEKLKNTILNGLSLLLFVGLLSLPANASKAVFNYKATFKRNKLIWGTYKMQKERLSLKRGKKSWNNFPEGRIGDIILSKGNFILLRETKVNSKTKIIVDKIPYKKIGKNTYINRSPLKQDVMDRLFNSDIMAGVPHRDLKGGEIDYSGMRCKKTRGALTCALKGEINPIN